MYHTITRVVVFVREERSNNDFANIKNLTSSFNCKFLDLDHLSTKDLPTMFMLYQKSMKFHLYKYSCYNSILSQISTTYKYWNKHQYNQNKQNTDIINDPKYVSQITQTNYQNSYLIKLYCFQTDIFFETKMGTKGVQILLYCNKTSRLCETKKWKE